MHFRRNLNTPVSRVIYDGMAALRPTPSSTYTALVADGDPDTRAAFARLLHRLGCATEEAGTGEEALAAARRLPTLVLLNVDLPDVSGYEICRELRDEFGESVAIVFISNRRVEPSDEVAGLLLGCDEFFPKSVRSDRFLARVRRLLAHSSAHARIGVLTPRELEVLSLLVSGSRPADIARDLYITTRTTSAHIEHILAKLGAHSQAQAVAFAVRDHLLDAR